MKLRVRSPFKKFYFEKFHLVIYERNDYKLLANIEVKSVKVPKYGVDAFLIKTTKLRAPTSKFMKYLVM